MTLPHTGPGPHQGRPQGPPQGPSQGPPRTHPQGPPQGPPQGGPHQPGPYQHPQQPQHPPRTPAQRNATLVAVLALAALLGVVLGLSVTEDDRTAWDTVNAWGGLAIVGAALTLAPAIAGAIGLTPQRAWQVSACGAGALILFWVLFTLPEVGSNTSLVTTIGVALGVIATWVAPGRAAPDGQGRPPQTW